MADETKGPEGAGQDASKAIPTPAAGGKDTERAPISSTAASPQNRAAANTASAETGKVGTGKVPTNPQGQGISAPQGGKTAQQARAETQDREGAAAAPKEVSVKEQKLTSNDIETQEKIAQASGRSIASGGMSVDMIKRINEESRKLQKQEEELKEQQKKARDEFKRQQDAISRYEATTIPGAPSLSPKSHMLDARAVAAQHPDKYLRWVNLRDAGAVGVRKAEGYQELPASEGGSRLGDEMVLMYLPKDVQMRKQAAQRARTRESFEAPNKDYEKQVDDIARTLRDKYNIRIDEREMRKGLEGE